MAWILKCPTCSHDVVVVHEPSRRPSHLDEAWLCSWCNVIVCIWCYHEHTQDKHKDAYRHKPIK